MARGRIVLACVLVASCALLSAHDPPDWLAAGEGPPGRREAPGVWRTTNHDGANCLYLLLSLSGRKVDYADVAAAVEGSGRGNSLAGLRDAARTLGVDSSVYQWGPRQLIRAPGPVIAHLDSYKEGGSFVLLFQATERNCYLVNGANVTIQELGAEDFRHAWSGYVLAPTQPTPSRLRDLLSCGIALLALAGYYLFRVRHALSAPVAGARSQVS